MAIMIPNNAKMFSVGSLEDVMFESFKNLSDDYYVFHSFKIVKNISNTINESETDFVIFNQKKGILCLEAKNGSVYYKNGEWYYGSGMKMKNDGPFSQASHNKWKLKNYIERKMLNTNDIMAKCKMLHAVWFPAISKFSVDSTNFPSDADKSIILTKEDLINPAKNIERIFDIELPNKIKTNLLEFDKNWLINNILCPSFNIVPSMTFVYDLKRNAFNQLFNEQSNILNYLEDQRSAVINGVAGTGKTMLAVEKARRHGADGQKVLFLCYNSNLKKYLSNTFKYENVSFYTIDGFACKFCKTIEADYKYFKEVLEQSFYNALFEYDHIIIDEGQDFGQENIEEESIIELLEFIVLNKNNYGTFYLFYDKLQFVQGKTIPKYILEADCKFSLYKNCRNTENIAKTSMKPLNVKPKLFEGCVLGDTPNFYVCNDCSQSINRLNKTIDKYLDNGLTDIVILTPKKEEQSCITDLTENNIYRYKNKNFKFYSCRRFKGLEADVVILIDIEKDTFILNEKVFYVGASRARLFLEIITNINEQDCVEVLDIIDKDKEHKRTRKGLATALNSIYEI